MSDEVVRADPVMRKRAVAIVLGAALVGAAAAGPLIEPWAPNTVEGMFDFIEQAARSADLLAVRYDRTLDYPTEIRGDQRAGLPDDWFWTTAGNVTPRR